MPAGLLACGRKRQWPIASTETRGHDTTMRYRLVILTLIMLLAAGCTTEPQQLLRPNGVAIAQDGSLYVMDRGNYRVVHLSPEGRMLGEFGSLGSDAVSLHTGTDIALDAQGNIYIGNQVYGEDASDLVQDSVKVFAPDGRFLREIGATTYTFSTTAQPNGVSGLDIDDQGRVYVADSIANTVRVFTLSGTLINTFFGTEPGEPPSFNGLVDVAVDDQRGLLYATDSINSRVQQFRLDWPTPEMPTLTHTQDFGTYGWRRGQLAYPRHLAVDEASGNVYVGDMANRRIQVFDPAGAYVNEFAAPILTENILRGGVGPWQVLGLALGQDGAIYAADAFNNTLWVFEPSGQLRTQIEVQ